MAPTVGATGESPRGAGRQQRALDLGAPGQTQKPRFLSPSAASRQGQVVFQASQTWGLQPVSPLKWVPTPADPAVGVGWGKPHTMRPRAVLSPLCACLPAWAVGRPPRATSQASRAVARLVAEDPPRLPLCLPSVRPWAFSPQAGPAHPRPAATSTFSTHGSGGPGAWAEQIPGEDSSGSH